jgi:hypothetical protein
MDDDFRDRVFGYLDATLERWLTLKPHNSLDIALDISGPDDPFEGANIEHLSLIVGEWCELNLE